MQQGNNVAPCSTVYSRPCNNEGSTHGARYLLFKKELLLLDNIKPPSGNAYVRNHVEESNLVSRFWMKYGTKSGARFGSCLYPKRCLGIKRQALSGLSKAIWILPKPATKLISSLGTQFGRKFTHES